MSGRKRVAVLGERWRAEFCASGHVSLEHMNLFGEPVHTFIPRDILVALVSDYIGEEPTVVDERVHWRIEETR